jgi:hypothetical protein
MKGIEHPIDLRFAYTMGWRDYSQVGPGPAERFRYLLVSVPGDR